MKENAEIRELYTQYGFLIYRRCLMILRSEEDARDALQSVFVQLIGHREAIRDSRKIVSWIYTAATNHCFNLLRARKKFDGSVSCDDCAREERTDETLDARRIITLALRENNRKVRDAVYYTYVENLNQEEIREITGQSPATIRRNLSRFKQSLTTLRETLETP